MIQVQWLLTWVFWVCKCMFGCVIVHFLSSPKFKNCELSLYCIVHFWFRENLSLPLQDVVLQWLMSETIQLNQIDAEDPEVSIYAQLCVCVGGGHHYENLMNWHPSVVVVFPPVDHRLHHVTRHGVFVGAAESVFAGGRWKPQRFHLSFWHVLVQFLNWHFTPCHQVTTQHCVQQLCLKQLSINCKTKENVSAVLTNSWMSKMSHYSWSLHSWRPRCLSSSLL